MSTHDEQVERVAGRIDADRAVAFIATITRVNLFKSPELAQIVAAYVSAMPKSEAAKEAQP